MNRASLVAGTLLFLALLALAYAVRRFVLGRGRREGAVDNFAECANKTQWWSPSRQKCMKEPDCTAKKGLMRNGRCYAMVDPNNQGDEYAASPNPITTWKNCKFTTRETSKGPKDEAACKAQSAWATWDGTQCSKCPYGWTDPWRGKKPDKETAQCVRQTDTACRDKVAGLAKSAETEPVLTRVTLAGMADSVLSPVTNLVLASWAR